MDHSLRTTRPPAATSRSQIHMDGPFQEAGEHRKAPSYCISTCKWLNWRGGFEGRLRFTKHEEFVEAPRLRLLVDPFFFPNPGDKVCPLCGQVCFAWGLSHPCMSSTARYCGPLKRAATISWGYTLRMHLRNASRRHRCGEAEHTVSQLQRGRDDTTGGHPHGKRPPGGCSSSTLR